jgi:DnaJ-class molecular chaperone
MQAMAEDPYTLLGLPRDATTEAIRTAYRKLARKHHPDLNPGNAESEARFKAISSAHDLLSDADRRARFDRGEIDAQGNEVPRHAEAHGHDPAWRAYAESAAGQRYAGSGAGGNAWRADTFEDLFGHGAGERGRGGGFRLRGHDVSYRLAIAFLDALSGATQRLAMPEGRTLDVKVPPGTASGQVLRLAGLGAKGMGGGEPGDALIEIEVIPHPVFRRDGPHVRLELPITLTEAVLGARVTVPTPTGPVALAVPPRAESGQVLRLRGRGVPGQNNDTSRAGDLLVTLKLVQGPPDPALEAFLRDHKPPEGAPDPRAALFQPPS